MTNPLNPQILFELAALEKNPQTVEALCKEVNEIMDFVSVLRAQDTTSIAPMFHPEAMHARLRPDVVDAHDIRSVIQDMTSDFTDDLFWVPQVVDKNT